MGSDRPHEEAELASYRKYNNDLGYYLDAKRVRYAKKLNTGGTVEAEKWETGSEQDSVVWRYARTIGYVPTSATERKDIVEDPSFLPEYLRGYASSAYSSSTIQNFGIFETYCMKWLPRRDYTKHLFALNEQMEALDAGVVNLRDVQRIKFVAPDEAIIVSFCDYLKSRQDITVTDAAGLQHRIAGRGNNWGTIKLKLASLSHTRKVFGEKGLNYHGGRLKSKIIEWKVGWDKSKAPSLDPCDLPLLFEAIQKHPTKQQPTKIKLLVQAPLQYASMSRSSCITRHCPKQGSVQFPDMTEDYAAGMPLWVEMTWLNWKKRSAERVGKPYVLRFHSNRIAKMSMFCIPLLMWMWIGYLKKNGLYNEDKPLWDDSPESYQGHIKDIFIYMAELSGDDKYLKYSSHSIRYGATRWARRCGADQILIRRVGRWVDLITLMEYLGEGEDDIRLDSEGIDPVQNIWVFNTVVNSAGAAEFPANM